MRRSTKVAASLVGAAAIVGGLAGACTGDETREPVGAVQVATTLGPGEGALNLVTLPGFVENGGSDPRVDWVKPFEERTGCTVSWKTVEDAQDMAEVMMNPAYRYDGVSAPPEVAGRLIEERHVNPVNTDLVDGYKKLEPKLRGLLKKKGRVYGVPFVWGSNLLMYDPRAVPPPSGWNSLFDPDSAARHSGKIIMRDSPLVIAEAALYLKKTDPDLDIEDPYSLTPKQLEAAAEVVAKQRRHVKDYWEVPADAVSAFAAGDAVLGQVWPYQVDVLSRAGRQVRSAVPSDGVTGWMNAWMIGARAEHPNCMYQWLQWTASPDVQQQVAEWNGVAPANPQACSGDRLKSSFCNAYHVGDGDYQDKVVFAHTPSTLCRDPDEDGDDDGKDRKARRGCTDYERWTQEWIKATKQ